MNMNCKYCGAGLPTKGSVCPNCGKIIPMSQQKDMQQMLDPRWNDYRNKDTAFYKQASNTDGDAKIGKAIALIVIVIIAVIILAIIV
jgi:hypothetical protein